MFRRSKFLNFPMVIGAVIIGVVSGNAIFGPPLDNYCKKRLLRKRRRPTRLKLNKQTQSINFIAKESAVEFYANLWLGAHSKHSMPCPICGGSAESVPHVLLDSSSLLTHSKWNLPDLRIPYLTLSTIFIISVHCQPYAGVLTDKIARLTERDGDAHNCFENGGALGPGKPRVWTSCHNFRGRELAAKSSLKNTLLEPQVIA
ncbi:hypothetical protein V6N13_127630 [Hibiscus sabdariffa]